MGPCSSNPCCLRVSCSGIKSSHVMRLFGESKTTLKQVYELSERAKSDWLWLLPWLGHKGEIKTPWVGQWLCGWTSHHQWGREHGGYLIGLPRCEPRQKGRMRLGNIQQIPYQILLHSVTSKVSLWSFITNSCNKFRFQSWSRRRIWP